MFKTLVKLKNLKTLLSHVDRDRSYRHTGTRERAKKSFWRSSDCKIAIHEALEACAHALVESNKKKKVRSGVRARMQKSPPPKITSRSYQFSSAHCKQIVLLK